MKVDASGERKQRRKEAGDVGAMLQDAPARDEDNLSEEVGKEKENPLDSFLRV